MKNIDEFTRKTLDTLTEQIAVIDETGKIIYVNKSWIDFSENNDGIIEFKDWYNVNYLDVSDSSAKNGDTLAKEASEGIKSVINSEKTVFYLEYPCHSPDEQRWFIMRVTSFELDSSNYYVLSHQNITERKLAEEALAKNFVELKKAQEIMIIQSRKAAIGEIVKMLAHQWRQPLAIISSSIMNIQIELELSDYDLETKQGLTDYQEFIQNEIKNMDGILQTLSKTINNFSSLSKTEDLKPIALTDVCKESLSFIESSLTDDGIEIICDYKSEKKLNLISEEIIQVLISILKNSQENFKEKNTKNPKIEIFTDNKSISICDNGGGIDEDIIDTIFEPYFTTKNQLNGMGLGLHMSRIIIENHYNGYIKVLNKDFGVCFKINFQDTI